MKKILISLVAVVGLLVAGEIFKNDILYCELPHENGKPLLRENDKTQCYLNFIEEKDSHYLMTRVQIDSIGFKIVRKQTIEGQDYLVYERTN